MKVDIIINRAYLQTKFNQVLKDADVKKMEIHHTSLLHTVFGSAGNVCVVDGLLSHQQVCDLADTHLTKVTIGSYQVSLFTFN